MSAAAPAPERRPIDWPRLLVWFMRLAATVWLAKGLLSWAAILGYGAAPLDAVATREQVRLVVLAVADPVAAVGLWLVAGWGGALWLMVVILETGLTLLAPGSPVEALARLAPQFALVGAFLGISILAAKSEGQG